MWAFICPTKLTKVALHQLSIRSAKVRSEFDNISICIIRSKENGIEINSLASLEMRLRKCSSCTFDHDSEVNATVTAFLSRRVLGRREIKRVTIHGFGR